MADQVPGDPRESLASLGERSARAEHAIREVETFSRDAHQVLAKAQRTLDRAENFHCEAERYLDRAAAFLEAAQRFLAEARATHSGHPPPRSLTTRVRA